MYVAPQLCRRQWVPNAWFQEGTLGASGSKKLLQSLEGIGV